MPPYLFNVAVNVYRRASTGVDSLNNPVYGLPTSGAGWSLLYTGMPVRLAFSSKPIQFAPVGERPTPSGIMYYGPQYTVDEEDRILTPDGIEYVVTSVAIGYGAMPAVVDHYEAALGLP